MSQKHVDVIDGAIRLLTAHPKAFTKRALARDKKGVETSLYSAYAVSFCVIGAVHLSANSASSYGARTVAIEIVDTMEALSSVKSFARWGSSSLCNNVVDYNNAPGVTLWDIVTLLSRAKPLVLALE